MRLLVPIAFSPVASSVKGESIHPGRALLLALALLLGVACRPHREPITKIRGGVRAPSAERAAAPRGMAFASLQLSEEQRAIVLAEGKGLRVTAGDFADALARQPLALRVRYQRPERWKEFLQDLVVFEVLARRAEAEGVDRDPLVLHAYKKVVAERWLDGRAARAVTPADITDADVDRAYAERKEIGWVPATLRGHAIAGDDLDKMNEARARLDEVAEDVDRVVARLKDMQKTHGDLAMGVGEDADTGYMDRKGMGRKGGRLRRIIPEKLAAAMFAAGRPGAIIGPLLTRRGYYLAVVEDLRPGYREALDEIRQSVRNRLVEERRAQARERIAREVVAKAAVRVDEETFRKAFGASSGGASPAPKAVGSPSPPAPAQDGRPRLIIPRGAGSKPLRLQRADQERLRRLLKNKPVPGAGSSTGGRSR